MKKRILSLVMALTLYVGLSTGAFAAGVTAAPSATKLVVNGKQVAVDAYTINQNNYIKLRDLATIVNGTVKNFNVTWDGAKNAINLMSKTPYVSVGGEMVQGDGKAQAATLATAAIYVDGVCTSMTAYVIGQNNYFKLRDVMQVFDVYVGWDQATGTASLDTGKSYEQPATTPAATDVSADWLNQEFTLDGVKYALPFSFQGLKSQGWSIAYDKYKDLSAATVVNPNEKIYGTITLVNSTYHKYFTFWVGFINNTATVQTIENCDVWSVKFDTMNGYKQVDSFPKVAIAKGITWGSTNADVQAAFGTPKETYVSTSTTSPKYTKYSYQYDYDKYLTIWVYDEFGVTGIEMKRFK